MMHLCTLVILEPEQDLQEALAPFDEGIEVEPYLSKTREEYLNEYRQYYEGKTDEEIIQSLKDDDGERFDDQGNLLSTYNPLSEWDWWQLGGRFSGFIPTKQGEKVDYCAKKDIDFEAKRQEKITEELKDYEEFHKIIADCPPFIPYEDIVKAFNGDYKKAKTLYRQQAAAIRLGGHKDFAWYPDLGRYLVTREEYLCKVEREVFKTYSLLHKGIWTNRPDDNEEWIRIWDNAIAEASEESIFYIVDCHI